MLLRSRSAFLLAAAAITPQRRPVSFDSVTPHLSLVRDEDEKGAGGAAAAGDRPLVVMLPWLLAKRPHVTKYAKLYTERGIDVLSVRTHPGHLLRPTKGSQVVAAELLQYLQQLPGAAPLLLHGFSVGGYLWGEALVQLDRQPDLRQALEKRFVGQVWDSVAELTEAPAGLARSVFPRTAMLQGLLEKLLNTYLSAFHNMTTRHFELSSQHFHNQPLHCPALLLLSRSDPIGTVTANEKVITSWKKMDITTRVKIWDGSPHVGHFRMYRAEYEEQIAQFLTHLGLGQNK